MTTSGHMLISDIVSIHQPDPIPIQYIALICREWEVELLIISTSSTFCAAHLKNREK